MNSWKFQQFYSSNKSKLLLSIKPNVNRLPSINKRVLYFLRTLESWDRSLINSFPHFFREDISKWLENELKDCCTFCLISICWFVAITKHSFIGHLNDLKNNDLAIYWEKRENLPSLDELNLQQGIFCHRWWHCLRYRRFSQIHYSVFGILGESK